jgi:hypothetical protein
MRDTVFSCHQPNFLPWIGYFHKILNSDIFVLLDQVQYTKNSVANRNKIKSIQGNQFVTIPISKKVNNSSFFSYLDAEIAQERWYEKGIKTIEQNYKKAPYYDEYKDTIFEILRKDKFCDINIAFIKFILLEFEIETKILLMSKLKEISGNKNDLLVSIGNHLNANIYLSGNGARSYNDDDKFKENNILIKYQEFEHPVYSQLHPPFTPFLSVLDLLFNEGKKGKRFFLKQV